MPDGERRGIFITLEGPDGGGKTTQARLLAERLRRAGVPAVHTREPGGTPIGEAIRELILNPANDLADATEVLLYAAARAQNVEQVIRPALVAGRVVIGDRFIDSSLAYQGYALGRGVEAVRQVNLFATGGLLPDFTLLLDVRPEEGLARVGGRCRGEAVDRIEQRKLDYHRKVREYYLALAAREPDRVRLIPTDGRTPEEVAAAIWAALGDRWPELFGGGE